MNDHEGYDALTDELATMDAESRPYRRPSDFPSARAFVETASRSLRATRSPSANSGEHDTAPGDQPSSAVAGAVSPTSSTKE